MSTTQHPDRVAIPVCGRELEGSVVGGQSVRDNCDDLHDEFVVDVGGITFHVDAADAVPVREDDVEEV